jgi:hypothetical protein
MWSQFAQGALIPSRNPRAAKNTSLYSADAAGENYGSPDDSGATVRFRVNRIRSVWYVISTEVS